MKWLSILFQPLHRLFQQMIVSANFETTRKFYATNEELIHDIGVAYQDVIKQFYDAGCRNLQLDDSTLKWL